MIIIVVFGNRGLQGNSDILLGIVRSDGLNGIL